MPSVSELISKEYFKKNVETVYTVGSGGHFASLQDAVDSLISRKPRNNNLVEIRILSGYKIPLGKEYKDSEGTDNIACLVKDADASHIIIRAEDSVVRVDENFKNSVFRTIRGKAPILDCLIDANHQGDHNFCCGYSAEMGSVGWVLDGAGVINSYGIGLRARQVSTIYCQQDGTVIFSGAGNRCVDVNHGSRVYIRNGDFSGSGNIGLRARGSVLVDAEGANFSNAVVHGIYAADASTIQAESVNCSNAGNTGILGTRATVINGASAVVNGCNVGIAASHGAIINLDNADITGNNTIGVRAQYGGRVACRNTNARKSSGMDSNQDFVVQNGGIITASGATGGKSQEVNITTSDGIIFDDSNNGGYETGTWTPSIDGATHTEQVGIYTKYGNIVHAFCRITLNGKGTGTGTVRISGLPYASNQALPSIGSLEINNIDLATNNILQIGSFISGGNDSITLRRFNSVSESWGGITYDEIKDNSRFTVTITYMI